MSRGGRTVCRYYLQGHCRFGNSCKFYHPNQQSSDYGSFGDRGGRREGGDGGYSRDQTQVCQFYLQGRCRYGDSCKFFHPGGRGRGGGGYEQRDQQPGTRQSRYQPDPRVDTGRRWDQQSRGRNPFELPNGSDRFQDDRHSRNQFDSGRGNFQGQWSARGRGPAYGGQSRSGDKYDQPLSASDIAAAVREDMSEWTEASIWPLSCYAYGREQPCLPGFREVSPEEMRLEAYEANQTGDSQRYLRGVQVLVEEQMSVRHKYGAITAADVSELISTAAASQEQVHGGLFGSASSSLFPATDTGPTSLFGGSSQSSSAGLTGLFGGGGGEVIQRPLFAGGGDGGNVGGLFGSAGGSAVHQDAGTSSLPSQAGVAPTQAELTEEELEAFKADKFVLGHIPEHPPPEVLCN